jgi:hypothetical protein
MSRTRTTRTRLLAAFLAAVALLPLAAQGATSSQTRSVATCVSGGGTGANWTNPGNAGASDDAYATVSVDGNTSDPLNCTDYGFAIPPNSTILGITVDVERKSNSLLNGGSEDASMRLLKAGVATGSDLQTATDYPTTDTVEAHGGTTNLWGTTWTPAEINAANFGALLTVTKPSGTGAAHTVSIDNISITVTYSPSVATRSPGTCASVNIGSTNWTNAANAVSSNNAYATATVGDNGTTDQLQCTNYQFNLTSLSASATIFGIVVNVERSVAAVSATPRDNQMNIIKGGTVGTTNNATATAYTTTDTVEAHGSDSNLWGETWTGADIRATNFGASLTNIKSGTAGGNVTFEIDHMPITVYYSNPPGTPTLSSPADGGTTTSATPAFDWTDVTDADGDSFTYEIQADTLATTTGGADCTFAAPEVNVTGLAASTYTPGAALSDGTYCWRARAVDEWGVAGAWSATRTIRINTVGSFDAVEASGAVGSRIFTKLVGTSFSLDLLAVKSGSVFTGYRGTVAVELVNASSGGGVCASMTQLQNTGTLSFLATDPTPGRKAQSFTYSSAAANVRVRLTDNTGGVNVVSCSSDNFTIRPQSFSSVTTDMTNTGSTGTPVKGAGDSFTITAAGGSGYTGTPEINNSALSGTPTAGTVSGSFNAGDGSGNASGTGFAYSEVGTFTLAVGGVRDISFVENASDKTNGDCIDNSASNTLSSGKYGCFIQYGSSITMGRFRPHHFAVLVSPTPTLTNRSLLSCSILPATASSFSYMNERFQLGFTLQAQNSSNNVTQNYAGATWAKLNLASQAALNVAALSGTTNLTSRLNTSVVPAGSFSAGNAALTLDLSFSRLSPDTTPDGPFTSVKIGIAPNDGDGAVLSSFDMDINNDTTNDRRQIGGNTEFRFGRLRISNASGSDKIDLSVPVRAEYWNGTVFALNSLDTCTALNQNNIALHDYAGSLAPSPNCKTFVSNAPITLSSGMGTIKLAKPLVTGSLRLTARLGAAGSPTDYCLNAASAPTAGANAAHTSLLGRWNDASNPDVATDPADALTKHDDNPSGRASFGIYGGQPSNFIFNRENY